ncbi:hypothetical protein HNQ64_004245 [Prosthecobacter dejongeii]|uniref:Uncharacterized protein n=1 Tax=Prosthecobacter dejongeii TaxID=48465 RepID=A0A7W7YPT2_9BACT|nr:hypothetical protein [Prosthecobacter dejongeii]MBB5039727.1 hypothetical protein [Prosthecobacter dejongeii]MBB5039967.1 hypothetical protein [Prosthecobacter dejongeii]
MPRKKRPWMDAIFSKIETLTAPLVYSTA